MTFAIRRNMTPIAQGSLGDEVSFKLFLVELEIDVFLTFWEEEIVKLLPKNIACQKFRKNTTRWITNAILRIPSAL